MDGLGGEVAIGDGTGFEDSMGTCKDGRDRIVE